MDDPLTDQSTAYDVISDASLRQLSEPTFRTRAIGEDANTSGQEFPPPVRISIGITRIDTLFGWGNEAFVLKEM